MTVGLGLACNLCCSHCNSRPVFVQVCCTVWSTWSRTWIGCRRSCNRCRQVVADLALSVSEAGEICHRALLCHSCTALTHVLQTSLLA